MKRCLFVSQRLAQRHSGAQVVAERNWQHCREIFGDAAGVYEFPRFAGSKHPLRMIGSLLRGNLDSLDARAISDLVARIARDKCDVVFFDSSNLGSAVRAVRRRFGGRVRIAVFYHDIVAEWWRSTSRSSGIRARLRGWRFRRSESDASRLADLRIVLTERDRRLLESHYGLPAHAVVPVSLPDRFSEDARRRARQGGSASSMRTVLFVGVDYAPNVEGVQWFIREVLPRVPVRLVVLGRGMDRHAAAWQCERVQVLGSVEDLAPHYYRADAVVIPLFSGGGMKVKTAEALMYGKTVFGTPEAFEGYRLEEDRAGGRCDDANAFVKALAAADWKTDEQGHNRYSREVFLRSYCYSVTLEQFRDLLQS